MVPNRSWCQIDSFTLLVPNWLRCQIGTGAKLTPFTPLVPNWFRCQIDSFYTLGAKLTLLHSWCQIGSGAKLTLLHSWCQIGPVPNWLRCQIDSGAKLVPVPNCPLIWLFTLYLISVRNVVDFFGGEVVQEKAKRNFGHNFCNKGEVWKVFSIK